MTGLSLLVAFLGAWFASWLTGWSGNSLLNRIQLLLAPALARRRRRALAAEIGPSLRLWSDSLAAGMTIPAAAARAGAGTGAAAEVLARFAESCSRGLTVSEGLDRLTSDPNGDLWAPAAFTIELHFRQGGDLADSLRRVAEQMESRLAGRERAQSATAQARFTANVVCAMPLLALAGVTLLSPGRVFAVVGNPASSLLMVTGLGLQAGCLITIRRISRS